LPRCFNAIFISEPLSNIFELWKYCYLIKHMMFM
jgi:hypothetical protein